MPPLVSPRPQTANSPGLRLANDIGARMAHERELNSALAEAGRPSLFQEKLAGADPISHAATVSANEGWLPGVAEIGRQAFGLRGSVGEPPDMLGALINKVRGIARGMNPKMSEDLSQGGMEEIVKSMQGESIGGPQAAAIARGKMQNMMSAGGTGVQKGPDATAVRNAINTLGEREGEFRLWSEARKSVPDMSLERFRDLRMKLGTGNPLRKPVSLDAPRGPDSGDQALGDLIRNQESPERAAILKEQLGKLTESQQTNLEKYLSGAPVNRAIVDRILRKAGVRGEQPPISGGATGPEDMSAEFPSSQFRDVLKRQPNQMFGQEGPKNLSPELAGTLQEYQQALAETGGGDRLARGAIPESGWHTLGAGRVAEDWDRLRSVLGNVGNYQGRN